VSLESFIYLFKCIHNPSDMFWDGDVDGIKMVNVVIYVYFRRRQEAKNVHLPCGWKCYSKSRGAIAITFLIDMSMMMQLTC
jgi:hypothetical protein